LFQAKAYFCFSRFFYTAAAAGEKGESDLPCLAVTQRCFSICLIFSRPKIVDIRGLGGP